jgi:dTDP-glucose 4,6-dehydratase
MEYNMKKIAVISGATGMSGNETVRKLLKKGYEVIAFDNFFASSIK